MIAISFAAPITNIINASPIFIALIRLFFSFLLLSPFLLNNIFRKKELPDRKLIKYTLLSSIFLSLHFIFWISSLKYTSVTSSVVLVTTNPLFVSIFSFVFLREVVKKKLKIAIFIVLLGGIIISSGDNITRIKLYGNILALLGAVMASLYIITGRKIRQEYSLVSYTTILYLFSTIILLCAAAVFDVPFSGYSFRTYLLIIFLAIVPQLMGHNAFNWALKYISPTLVAMLILFEPIGATIINYFFSGYIPDANELIGSVFILIGIILSIM